MTEEINRETAKDFIKFVKVEVAIFIAVSWITGFATGWFFSFALNP